MRQRAQQCDQLYCRLVSDDSRSAAGGQRDAHAGLAHAILLPVGCHTLVKQPPSFFRLIGRDLCQRSKPSSELTVQVMGCDVWRLGQNGVAK